MYSFLTFVWLYSLCSFYVPIDVGLKLYTVLNPKTAWGWWGQFELPPVVFQREGETLAFCDF